MAIDALVTSRMHSAAERRTSASGKEFVTCRVRVSVGSESLLCSVICFDAKACEALLALQPGESVALSGELTPRLWQPEGREPRVGLNLVAHSVLSPHSARRKRQATRSAMATTDAIHAQA